MKTLRIVFFIVFATLVSCNNDDDNNDSNIPEIVGKWTMEIYIDEDGESSLTNCVKQTFFEFFESGNYNFTSYADNFDSGGCEPFSPISGSWEIISDNEIKLTNNNQENIGEFEIFQENGNTFLTIVDFESDNNFTEITFIKN